MNIPNVVILCQARTSSTRLPRKILLPLAGAPLLLRFYERVSRCSLATSVIIATTIEPADDPVAHLCQHHNIRYYRGHPTDLLDRHVKAAENANAEVVVKIPSDCPLIDPEIIDRVIADYLEYSNTVDYVSNLHPPTYPDGNDVEVMSVDALRRAHALAVQPHEREHTTPWLWDGNPAIRMRNVMCEDGNDYSMVHRWTIDYAEDYMFIKSVYDELYHLKPNFGMHDVLDLMERRPEIAAINSHLVGVNWYRDHLHNLRTITADQTRTYPPAMQ